MQQNSLKPHELVDLYSHAKNSRLNSWAFSLLACAGMIAGTTAFVSNHPQRVELTLGCFAGSLFLCDRAKKAGETASKYGRRVCALEQFSEETTIHLLRQSVAPSLPAIAMDAELLPSTGSPEADAVLQCLADFDVESRFERAIKGPSFTRLFLRPAKGQKISGFMNLGSELQIALGLQNPPLISVTPGGVALDLPNTQRAVLKFSQFCQFEQRSALDPLLMAVGVDLSGELIELDLSDPGCCHALGGGVTGSGKSEFLKTGILSLIGRYTPDAVKLAIADVKRISFTEFEGMPWLYSPIAKDPEEVVNLLNSLVEEMEARYQALEWASVADLAAYNRSVDQPYPRIVAVLDEYSETLAQSDKMQRTVIQKATMRLARKGRAAGIHLLVFTQRPDAEELDTQLRSNLPVSIGLKVQRVEESQIIMGIPGAGCENLLGKGDLLLRRGSEIVRLQAPIVDSDLLVRKAIARYQSPAIAPPSQAPTLEQFSQEFQVTDTKQTLEKLFNLPSVEPPTTVESPQPPTPEIDWDEVPDHLHELIKFSLKYGWVTARKVKQNVRLYSSSSTDEIRGFFLAAMNAGVGMTRGEGDRLQYAAILGETRDGC